MRDWCKCVHPSHFPQITTEENYSHVLACDFSHYFYCIYVFISGHLVQFCVLQSLIQTIKKWNINIQNSYFLYEYTFKCNQFLWSKLNFFSNILQSSVSQNSVPKFTKTDDQSEIILICQKKWTKVICVISLDQIKQLIMVWRQSPSNIYLYISTRHVNVWSLAFAAEVYSILHEQHLLGGRQRDEWMQKVLESNSRVSLLIRLHSGQSEEKITHRLWASTSLTSKP